MGPDMISDGITNFPCIFSQKKAKKGSYLRLKKWELNLDEFHLILHDYQYIGGEGYEIKMGKGWDLEQIKYV